MAENNESGFLHNPNEQPENEVTLADIKGDTEGILSELKSIGRQDIEIANEANKIAKQQEQKNRAKQNNDITNLLEKGVILQQRSLKSIEKQPKRGKLQKTAEKPPLASHSQDSPSQQPRTTADKIEQARRKRSQKESSEIQAPISPAESNTTPSKKSAQDSGKAEPAEEALPNDWKRDKNGRIRDAKARFVDDAELAKHGLSNPEKKGVSDTEREASEFRLLDSIKDIKDAIEAPDNVDPLIDSFKEVTAPIAGVWNIGKTVTTTFGRGFKKVFGSKDKEKDEKRRFSSLLSFFRKSDKTTEKRENKIIDWLRRIWKKDENGKGGWLLGLLPLLASLIISSLKLFFSKSLGGLKGIFKGLGTMFKGLGSLKALKSLGTMFKGLGGLTKGFAKRIPILGSLLAFSDGGMAGGIGALLGAGVGTLFGPIGTVIGGLVGEKLGVWLAGLNWKEIGNQISAAWDSTTKWLGEAWNNALTWFDNTFPELSASMKEAWQASTDWISEKWTEVSELFSSYWDGASQWVSQQWTDITESLLQTWEGLTSWMSEKWQGVKDGVSGAWEWVSSGVTNLFGGDHITDTNIEMTAKNTDNLNVNTDNLNKEQIKANGTLEAIGKWLGDIYALTKEKMNALINKNTPQYSVDENGVPVTSRLFNENNTIVSSVASNAADYAATHAAADSLGKCAEYVNNALRSQGIKVHGHGKDVAGNLIGSQQGFEEVAYSADYVPQVGDVMSMPSHSKSDHNYGHVAIYTKDGWVSDFKQGEKYGNTGAANAQYWEDIQSGRIKPTIARKSLSLTERYMASANKVADNIAVQSGSIAGLSTEQTQAYLSKVASKESGGRLDVVNKFGYMGLYQHGAAALVEAGLIDRGKYEAAVKMNKGIANGSDGKAHTAFLDDPRNWTIQGGKQTFLSSKALQDKAMIDFTNKNASYLQKSGVFKGSAEHKAGLLMAAHLKGVGGATKLANGIDSKDGNGTRASTYYNEGVNAIKNAKSVSPTTTVHSTPLTGITQNIANVAMNTGVTVPKINSQAQPNYASIASEVQKVKPKEKEVGKEVVVSAGQDPIFQFLTQDVSERRIAHIVTGGLLRKSYI